MASLQQTYPLARLRQTLTPADQWRPFPKIADRQAWETLNASVLNRQRGQAILSQARALAQEPWPALPAALYMAYARVGDRRGFEAPYFNRRHRLGLYALAECLQAQSEFVDPALDAAWAICEEASWCLPAHNSGCYPEPTGSNRDPLPRAQGQAVDLFAAETAAVLAETIYLLESPLQAVSPEAVARVRQQVLTRVIEPLERDYYRAAMDGHNNWTPWITSNALIAAMILLEDPDRLAAFCHKMLGGLDRFIAGYGEDGGCDEGPMYWNRAAAEMFLALDLLRERTHGAVNPFGDAKIRAMGHYITVTHLAGPWFAPFADAGPKPALCPAAAWRYGQRTGDPALQHLALDQARQRASTGKFFSLETCGGMLHELLGDLFWMPADLHADLPPVTADTAWLPDVQVLVARRADAPLVLAAKGGHNAESHNHNDLGHFIVMAHGHPGIVDVGRGVYTRQTFSDRRYELWFTRGLSHNAPVVNGIEQAPGATRRTRDVSCQTAPGQATLSMDLTLAYPEEARLETLVRRITWTGQAVTVEDRLTATQGPLQATVCLLTVPEPEIIGPKQLRFRTSDGVCQLDLQGPVAVRVEELPLTDTAHKTAWGERLWQVFVESASDGRELTYAMTMSVG